MVKAQALAAQDTMPEAALQTLFDRQRSAFARERMPTLAARRDRLEKALKGRGEKGE